MPTNNYKIPTKEEVRGLTPYPFERLVYLENYMEKTDIFQLGLCIALIDLTMRIIEEIEVDSSKHKGLRITRNNLNDIRLKMEGIEVENDT